MKKAAGVAAAAFAAAGIASYGKQFIDLASNAEQSMGGVQAVFKNYADNVVKKSKEADRALGLSGNSYRELSTLIGSQLKNAGVPMDELGGKTDGLITMGADLAAMFGGTTADAVGALSSALKGEMDPIEKYGISLNEAALKAEAAAMGLEVVGGTLTNSQRAMVVMSLVTKQGADAVGAFGRESDTAAGRAARASAQWENLKTAIGDRLLPIWSALMDFIGKVVLPGLSGVGTAIDSVVNFFGALGDILIRGDFTKRFADLFNVEEDSGLVDFLFDIRDALTPIVDFVRDHATPILAGLGAALAAIAAPFIISAIGSLAGMVGGVLAGAFGLLLSPVALVALAIGGIVGIFVSAYKASEPLRDAVDKLRSAFGIFFDAFNEANGAGGIQGFFDGIQAGLAAALPVVREALGEMGTALWSWIRDNIGPALTQLGSWLSAIVGWVIGTGLPLLLETYARLGAALWSWITPMIGPALAKIGEFLGALVGWLLGTGLPWLVGALVDLGQTLVEWIGPRIAPMLAEIAGFLGAAVGWIFGTGVPWLWDTLVDLGSKLVEWIAPRIPGLLGELASFMTFAVGWILTTGIPLLIGAMLKLSWELITWIAPRIPGLLAELLKFILSATRWIITDGLPLLFRSLWEMGTGAVRGIWESMQASPLFSKLGEIFNGALSIIKGVWDRIQEVIKAPLRIAFNFVNDRMIDPVNLILKAFPGDIKIPYLPRLREGGLVRGPGTPTSDSILGLDQFGAPTALVSRDEFVVNARAAAKHRSLIEAINSDNLPAFATGGLVGDKGGPLDWVDDAWDATGGKVVSGVADAAGSLKNFAVDMLEKGARKAAELILKPILNGAKALIPNKFPLNMAEGGLDRLYNAVLGKGDEQDAVQKAAAASAASVGQPGPPIAGSGKGYAQLFAIVKAAFPEARMNSSYRPGDPGYHGSGQAVDLGWMKAPGGSGNAYLAAMNQWIYDNFRNSRELIYNGSGDNRPNLKNGANYPYNAATQAQHRNHVHWVYDDGGLLEPGVTTVNNKSGKPEAVLTYDEMQSYKALLAQGGAAPLVGQLTIQVGQGADVRDGMEEAMFQLRRIKRGAGTT